MNVNQFYFYIVIVHLAAVTKYLRLGSLKTQKFIFHNSEAGKFNFKA
jgi:hypothetical protein